MLDVARAYTDIGDAHGAVQTLQKLKRVAPDWMRHHTLSVSIIGDLQAGPVQPTGLRRLAEYVGV